MKFKLAMTLKELKKRTSKSAYRPVKFLKLDSREVKKLSNDDLLVLMHLTRAAKQFDVINLKLENHHNLEFLEFLNKEIENGNKKAVLAKKMFDSQKSMFSPDALGNQTKLVLNVERTDGQGYFPEDLKVAEFHEILSRMLDRGEIEKVREILNQRSIVVRDGDELVAIDFVEALPEFQIVADELEKAIHFSSDKKFNKYLELQVKALRTADPKLDVEADKAWAKLDGGKFEFTICRECYTEKLTKSIYENKELLKRIEDAGITVYAKDTLGARVGIVNKAGTKLLKKLKQLSTISAKFMPYQNEYKTEDETDEISQTAVDVDLITLTGDEGAYRASLVLAQNLPNDDKPSLAAGGGRRNVYHRQVRLGVNKKLYKNLINDEQFKYFNPDADHWAVICHENTHSLGPRSHSSLGKFSSILEEYKADMGMYAFLDEFVAAGAITDEQSKEIILTSLTYGFLKGKPTLDQAHRTRSVMICNRMFTEKAITLDDDGKLKFNFEKVKAVTKQMMREVIRLQIDRDVEKAREYVEKWFVWSNEIQHIADIINKLSKKLNGYLSQPLADAMLEDNFEEILKTRK
ncbi:MAG: hypothetical protein IJ538_03050 [Clostridia bacterium]|nr:hypothetical protein [Clostridia bacterium]